MGKTTFRLTILTLVIFTNYVCVPQNYKPFVVRHNSTTEGGNILIGNNIVNRFEAGTGTDVPCNDPTANNGFLTMKYIDIDGDPTTFSSSSAKLERPPLTTPTTFKIVYAGLYWGAILLRTDASGNTIDRTNIDKVKIKTPFSGYTDITGSIIYDDANTSPTSNDLVYACYADISSLFAGQTNTPGDYTVANILSSEGNNPNAGLAGGWTLYIVYEDPNEPSRYITTFDGFSMISSPAGNPNSLSFTISGFKTIPVGTVKADFSFSTIEGDADISGDKLLINGRPMTPSTRPAANFFNSKITNDSGILLLRTPASLNTLGFDAGMFNVNNGGLNVIDNNDTSAQITLQSTQDKYYFYFCALAVDIIEPEVRVIKSVQNSAGVDLGENPVLVAGTNNLKYVLTIQNVGNEDIDINGVTIKDLLPDAITLGHTITVPLDVIYTTATTGGRTEITFTIPRRYVKKGDPAISIEIPFTVSQDCAFFKPACKNIVENIVYSTYRGDTTGATVTDQPSLAYTPSGTIAGPATFYVDISTCPYISTAQICAGSVPLRGEDGYTYYKWAHTETPNPPTDVLSTNQSIDAFITTEYYVFCTSSRPKCAPIYEKFVVSSVIPPLSGNPIDDAADAVVEECDLTGEKMPVVFLTDNNPIRPIDLSSLTGTYTFLWERLDDTSCTATTDNCPNLATTCTWTSVGTNSFYNVNAAGKYRVKVSEVGGAGCYRYFYINAFFLKLDPQITTATTCKNDDGLITINASGGIILPSFGTDSPYIYTVTAISPTPSLPATVVQTGDTYTNFPSGKYQFSIYSRADTAPFSYATASLTIDLPVVSVVTSAVDILCNGDKLGQLTAVASGSSYGNYKYYLMPAVLGIENPSTTGVFVNLPANIYTVDATSGVCSIYSLQTEIKEPPAIVASPDITHIKCYGQMNGKIVLNSSGGVGVHKYACEPNLDQFVANNVYSNLVGGTYKFVIKDENQCQVPFSIDVIEPQPFVPTIVPGSVVPETCAGDKKGAVSVKAKGGTSPYTISMQGITLSGDETTEFAFTNILGGPQTLFVKDSRNCNYEPEIFLPEAPNFNPEAAITYICTNDPIKDINIISANVEILPNQVNTYTSTFQYILDSNAPQAQNTFTNVSLGTHNVDVVHQGGCTKSVSFVVVYKEFSIVLRQGGLNELIADVSIESEDYQYIWNGENTGNNNKYLYYKTGKYTVEVVDKYGCAVTASGYYYYIDITIPNVFTPNGDGYNDKWEILMSNNYPDLVIQVYDRYGRHLAELKGGEFWDGTYNGTDMPTGDYWYIIKLNNAKDNREFTGAVTLYR